MPPAFAGTGGATAKACAPVFTSPVDLGPRRQVLRRKCRTRRAKARAEKGKGPGPMPRPRCGLSARRARTVIGPPRTETGCRGGRGAILASCGTRCRQRTAATTLLAGTYPVRAAPPADVGTGPARAEVCGGLQRSAFPFIRRPFPLTPAYFAGRYGAHPCTLHATALDLRGFPRVSVAVARETPPSGRSASPRPVSGSIRKA